MLTIDQILSLIPGKVREIIHEREGFTTATATTVDATPVEIIRVTPDDNTSGIIEVVCIGADGTGGVTGKKAKRFIKYGTLTMGSDVNIIPVVADTSIGAATFSIAADGGDIVVTVTGVADAGINWKADYQLTTVQNEIAL